MAVLHSELLLEKLKSAFQGVTRDGGISWLQADVIDDYGSAWDREYARTKETDFSWMDVAHDPAWTIQYRDSNWSFLDAIGFRYYIAAAIARHLIFGDQVLDDFRLVPRDNHDKHQFSKDQIAVIIGYLEYCENEDALNSLDREFESSSLDFDEYIRDNGEYDLEPQAPSSPIEYWTQVLTTLDS